MPNTIHKKLDALQRLAGGTAPRLVDMKLILNSDPDGQPITNRDLIMCGDVDLLNLCAQGDAPLELLLQDESASLTVYFKGSLFSIL